MKLNQHQSSTLLNVPKERLLKRAIEGYENGDKELSLQAARIENLEVRRQRLLIEGSEWMTDFELPGENLPLHRLREHLWFRADCEKRDLVSNEVLFTSRCRGASLAYAL